MRAPLASARAGGLAGRPCAEARARILAAGAQRAGRGAGSADRRGVGAGGGGISAWELGAWGSGRAPAAAGGPSGPECGGMKTSAPAHRAGPRGRGGAR